MHFGIENMARNGKEMSSSDPSSSYPEGKVVFEKPEGGTLEGKPALAFVNFTGPVSNIIRDSGTRRSIRKHVMRDIGRNRRASAVSTVPHPVATQLMPTISNRSSGRDLRDVRASSPRCAFTGCYNPGPYSKQPFMSILNLGGKVQCCTEHQRILGNAAKPPAWDEALQIEIRPLLDKRRITSLWSGRMNPFIPYPIKLTGRVCRFIDHSE